MVLRLIEDEHLTQKQLNELRRSAASSPGPKRRGKKGEAS